MADGVAITQGTGKIVATDDVSGSQYQIVKIDYGADGATSPFTGTILKINEIGTLPQVTIANPTGTVVTVDHGTVTLSNPTGTTVQFNNGTVDLLKAGTVSRVEQGSIQVTAGTISSLPNIPGGTVGQVTNLAGGTLTRILGGTITSISALPTVTLSSLGLTTDAITSNGEAVTVLTGGRQTASFNITGTWNATLSFQAGVDNTTWAPAYAWSPTLSTYGTSTTANATFLVNVAGYSRFRVIATSYTSGTATVNLDSSYGGFHSMTQITGGTIGELSSVSAGTITRLEQGSVQITAGTVTALNAMVPSVYDNITAAYPDGTTETYAFKLGTTAVKTITVTYTDSTKGSISFATAS